jgi:Fe2+ or Zn2+ uptake regulation protein
VTVTAAEKYLLTIFLARSNILRMGRRIREELKQSRPFASLEEEVVVEIQRTAQNVMRWLVEELKPIGLTPSQYNVLRILRGSSPEPLSATEICSRMVTHDPDLTRLMDRLEAAGLVRKQRGTRDRRVVDVHITPSAARRSSVR